MHMRFVVGTDTSGLREAVQAHLAQSHGFADVQVSEPVVMAATRLDPDNAWVRFALQSIQASTGAPPAAAQPGRLAAQRRVRRHPGPAHRVGAAQLRRCSSTRPTSTCWCPWCARPGADGRPVLGPGRAGCHPAAPGPVAGWRHRNRLKTMLRTLKDLFDTLLAPPGGGAAGTAADAEHRLQLATAVLLVEVMRADTEVSPMERDAVLAVLQRKFTMNTAVCGRSGLRVSASAPCRSAPGSRTTTRSTPAAAVEMMAAAYDAGVNFFDNAEVYAGGRSEEIMGQALKTLAGRG
jgi:hypothetical protein